MPTHRGLHLSPSVPNVLNYGAIPLGGRHSHLISHTARCPPGRCKAIIRLSGDAVLLHTLATEGAGWMQLWWWHQFLLTPARLRLLHRDYNWRLFFASVLCVSDHVFLSSPPWNVGGSLCDTIYVYNSMTFLFVLVLNFRCCEASALFSQNEMTNPSHSSPHLHYRTITMKPEWAWTSLSGDQRVRKVPWKWTRSPTTQVNINPRTRFSCKQHKRML